MKNKNTQHILFIARLILTTVLLVFIFKKVDFNVVEQGLYTANKT